MPGLVIANCAWAAKWATKDGKLPQPTANLDRSDSLGARKNLTMSTRAFSLLLLGLLAGCSSDGSAGSASPGAGASANAGSAGQSGGNANHALKFTKLAAVDQATVDDFVRKHFFSNRKA